MRRRRRERRRRWWRKIRRRRRRRGKGKTEGVIGDGGDSKEGIEGGEIEE